MEFRTIDDGHVHRREMWIDDETNVAHLYVIDLPMRIGDAVIRMAGIGDVYTEREHRMKGYMRYLYEDTLTYMTEQGYDVSMLFGIPDFYTKFGYAVCLPQVTFTIKTRDAEAAEAEIDAGSPRPIESRDMEAVLALYASENAGRTGTLVRDPERFTEFEKGTYWGVRAETSLWEDASGSLLGYAVWDKRPTEVKVAEVEAWGAALFPAILRAMAAQAVEKRCEEITFHLPPDHAFSEFAQRFGISWKITYPRTSDGMMRIMNQRSLFEKLLPVLGVRLAARPSVIPPDSLAFETELGVTTLVFDGSKVTLGNEIEAAAGLALSQDKLIQLLMGYRSARDLLSAEGVRVRGGSPTSVLPLGGREMGASVAGAMSLPALEVLFPKGVPFVWAPDHF
jgi:predicted acetyltransferase